MVRAEEERELASGPLGCVEDPPLGREDRHADVVNVRGGLEAIPDSVQALPIAEVAIRVCQMWLQQSQDVDVTMGEVPGTSGELDDAAHVHARRELQHHVEFDAAGMEALP